MNQLKSFIIGSNGLIAIMFYLIYFNIPNNMKTLSNEKYALLPPLYFGLMNIFMVLIKEKYQFDDMTTVFLTSLLSSMIVFSVAYYNKVYKIHEFEWITYLFALFILHLMAFSIINIMNKNT